MLYMPQRYDARTFLICVDSYDDIVCKQGSFIIRAGKKSVPFAVWHSCC